MLEKENNLLVFCEDYYIKYFYCFLCFGNINQRSFENLKAYFHLQCSLFRASRVKNNFDKLKKTIPYTSNYNFLLQNLTFSPHIFFLSK